MRIKRIVSDLMDANCYILIDDVTNKAVIIDSGIVYDKVVKELKSENLDLKGIVHTHGHADHIIDDNKFDLPVWIHKQDYKCLVDPDRNLSSMLGMPVKIRNSIYILQDKEKIPVGDLFLEVIHTPGHSPGSVCLKVEDVLFTGDTLFFEGVGRTDFPLSSNEELIASLQKKIYVLDENIKVYPGHGQSTILKHEKYYNPFIRYK